MKIYCVQHDIAWENRRANFAKVESLLAAAKPEAGSLVLLPEMFASGFSMNVTDAIKTRISVRAFKPDPIPEALIREIIDVARFAPSGGNLQPWKVIAVAGAERDAVVALARANLPGDEGERRGTGPARVRSCPNHTRAREGQRPLSATCRGLSAAGRGQ